MDAEMNGTLLTLEMDADDIESGYGKSDTQFCEAFGWEPGRGKKQIQNGGKTR